MNENTAVKDLQDKDILLSASLCCFIDMLQYGPARSHSQLRVRFFGAGRSKEKANTSYDNKRNSYVKRGIIEAVSGGGYKLTTIGDAVMAFVHEHNIDLSIVKSAAQLQWEMSHPVEAVETDPTTGV